MSNPNKVILGLLGAAAAGVMIGILLAPDKGGEVRKKIADKATDFASRIGELISTGKEKLEEGAGKVANKSGDFAEEINNRIEKTSNSLS
ncbi:MAG: YtxH domain-containing protein [Ferruginibacter sp.]|nr:YtxH domain-containing protein [Ferruginibacter sp.]